MGALDRARPAIQAEYNRRQSVMRQPHSGERWQPEYERELPLEAPMISLEDVAQLGVPTLAKLLGGKGSLAAMGALGTMRRSAPLIREAPQAEALRLAQQRAALPVERGGLGLHPENIPQERANVMFPTSAFRGSNFERIARFRP